MVVPTQPLQKLEIVFLSVWRTAWTEAQVDEWTWSTHSASLRFTTQFILEIHPLAAVRGLPPGFLPTRSYLTLSLRFSPYKPSWTLHHFQGSSPDLVLQALNEIMLSFLHWNSIQILVASPSDWALACVIFQVVLYFRWCCFLCWGPFSGIFSLHC